MQTLLKVERKFIVLSLTATLILTPNQKHKFLTLGVFIFRSDFVVRKATIRMSVDVERMDGISIDRSYGFRD